MTPRTPRILRKKSNGITFAPVTEHGADAAGKEFAKKEGTRDLNQATLVRSARKTEKRGKSVEPGPVNLKLIVGKEKVVSTLVKNTRKRPKNPYTFATKKTSARKRSREAANRTSSSIGFYDGVPIKLFHQPIIMTKERWEPIMYISTKLLLCTSCYLI